MRPVFAVVGPTASGKTAVAIQLAHRLGAEIVSADSMQVYRGMEIGTAAPTAEERALVPHHFVGIRNPDEPYSAGEFQRDARELIDRLQAQGTPVVVVGGSGLYLRALIQGLFEGPPKDEAIRERLRAEAEAQGTPALYERLRAVDPEYAAAILPGDLRRIVRALEVYEQTGVPLSRLHREQAAERSLPVIQVALDYPRDVLYARIERRVDRMLEEGLLDEVRRLLERGYEPHLRRLRSLGYPELIAHLRGESSFEEARAAIKQNTRRFAKRQLSWFRGDPAIHWLPAGESLPTPDQILALSDESPGNG